MSEHPPPRIEHESDDAPDPVLELGRHLAGIATVLLAPGPQGGTARRIATLAVATMESCDEAAVCGDHGRSIPASSSALMSELDALQREAGHGPCLDALAGTDTVYVPDLLDDRAWPGFSPVAARLGLRSALSYRLSVGEQTVGALQLYARLPGAFNAHERAQGLVFASFAALALAQARANEIEASRVQNLETALSSREVIGQAQGILMERERITADQAFQLLRRSSQHLNLKLSAVAQEIVDTGALPGKQ